jgi:hypothetical protein
MLMEKASGLRIPMPIAADSQYHFNIKQYLSACTLIVGLMMYCIYNKTPAFFHQRPSKSSRTLLEDFHSL